MNSLISSLFYAPMDYFVIFSWPIECLVDHLVDLLVKLVVPIEHIFFIKYIFMMLT
jgi:hypothetical protein